MALVRQQNDVLKYLLNEYSNFWPTNLMCCVGKVNNQSGYSDWFTNLFFKN